MPLLTTEYGVPSSLGAAHVGPLGRDQGDHTEQEAMATNADLMRMLEDKGVSGAFVFSWRTSGSSGRGTPSSTRTSSAASSGTTRSPTSSGSA